MLVIGCTAPFHTLVLAHGPLRGLVLNCLSRFGVRKPYERPSAISTARRCMCHRRRCILKRSAHSRDCTNPILRLCAVAVTGRVIARTDCGRWRSCWSTTTVDQALHCRGDMSDIHRLSWTTSISTVSAASARSRSLCSVQGRPPSGAARLHCAHLLRGGGMQGTPQVDCADGHCASCVGGICMQGTPQVDCDESVSDWQPAE